MHRTSPADEGTLIPELTTPPCWSEQLQDPESMPEHPVTGS